MIEVEGGTVFPRCATALHVPGVGPIVADAVVTFRFIDSADQQSGATATATLAVGTDSDWCADITAPTADGVYLLENKIVYQDFDPVYQYDTVRVGPAMNVEGKTRAEIRQAIGIEMGDFTPVIASSGGTNQISDPFNLYEPDDVFVGQEIVFTAAHVANVGRVARITQSAQTGTTLTFTPALPQPIVAGDRAEIYNLRAVGTRVHELHAAINAAIDIAAGMGGHRISATTAAFDRTNPFITIPAVFSHIIAVEHQNRSGDWLDITRLTTNRGAGYFVDHANRRIELVGESAYAADSFPVTVRGLGRPTPLRSDSEMTTVNAEWLKEQAKALLFESRYSRDPSLERMMTSKVERADQLRDLAVPRRPRNAVRVD